DLPDFGEPYDFLRLERPGSEQLPTTSNEDLMWFLGVYLGDGYLHERGAHTSVEIAVDASDEELVAEIVRVAAGQFGIELRLASDGLRLVGRHTAAVAEWLYLNGFEGNAHTKRVPDWVH